MSRHLKALFNPDSIVVSALKTLFDRYAEVVLALKTLSNRYAEVVLALKTLFDRKTTPVRGFTNKLPSPWVDVWV